MFLLEVISNGRSLVFFNPLVKMSARIADIPCITQVTLKIIHNALLIHKGWLVFPHFDFILDFPTRVHGADVKTESKVSEDAITQQQELKKQDPIRIVLPFKDQKSANSVRRQLGDLSRKINVDVVVQIFSLV